MPIENRHNGTIIITGNAINWYQVKVVISAMQMYLKHGMQVTRAASPQNLKHIATQYTGKTYARSRKGLETALADLETLVKDADPDSIINSTR